MASSSTNQRELTVRSHHYDNEVLIEMTDTGPGMDADTLKDVFKPFVSTKGAAGMGMGLSICRSIMEAHHGEIWAESEPGHGATFYIKLPVDNEAAMSGNTDGQLVVSETGN
jgi:signal transduction histidine kinase